MFKNNLILFFSFVFQFLITGIHAQLQQLRFKHYTTNEGLSQGDIYHMAQDSHGFMWFGTFDGLNRFDGYNFKVFRPNYNDTNSIKGERINSIIEDKNGMIWVGTNEALNRYDFKTGGFEHFYVQDSSHKKLNITYDPFFIDDKNELWFTYGFNDLGSMNLMSGKITTYPFAHGALDEFTATGYPEKEFYRPVSKIYSAGIDGLRIIDIKNKQTHFYFSSNSKNQSGEKTCIRYLLEDKNQILWLAGQNGLISFNPLTNNTLLYDKYDETKKITALSSLAWDKNNNIWCGSYGIGLNLFNTTTRKFSSNYIKNSTDPENIEQNNVISLFIDKDSDVWVGIDPYGVDKINPSYEQLNHVKINPEKKNGDYTSSIWSVEEIDTNNLLICSNHQDLIIYNKIKSESRKFYLPGEFKAASIYHTIIDSKKRIWIASYAGIFYSDDNMKTIKIMFKSDFYNPYIVYKAYLFEYNKRILIGTGNGLFSLPMDNQTIDADTMHLFDRKQINIINKSPQGLLTVATGDNEWFLIYTGGTEPRIIKKKNFDFLIKSIFFQDENIVWFGTGSGLARYSIPQDSLKIFTEKDGLANNFVYCLLKGNDGNLWMSTNHGISKFDLATERFSNYGIPEGAQSLEFNTHSFFQSPSGTIYFGGVKGFNYFNPSRIKKFDFEPPVEVLNISVNNNPVSLDFFLNQSQPVKLSSGENNISIEFAAIDFNRKDNINYLYRLRNKDAWISIGNTRILSFANLSPGDYNPEIKAQYSNNTISPHILKLAFTVLPPFYETAWFIALICAFIILIIYSIYRYRISQFLKLQAIRNNIARDLHDDIGSTLGSINMYTEVAAGKLKKEQPEDAEEVLKKMGTASREMIERMSDIVWSINSRNDRFENLRHRMQAFAAGMLSQREIEFTFDVQEELNKTVFSMKLRKNIFLIFKEAIHNIAKYAQCKKASIVLSIKDNIFKMVIKDDGKGFDVQNNPAYNGDGIKNMRTRSEEIGARLNINSNINEGTSVELIAWL